MLADRDDAGRMPRARSERTAEHADDDGVVEPSKRNGDLGEDVLSDDEERDAMTLSDHDPDHRDEWGIREAEHDLRPRAT